MKDIERLREILSTMTLPVQKAGAGTDADIQWLGRNVALRNAGHPDLDEARDLLEKAGARLVM